MQGKTIPIAVTALMFALVAGVCARFDWLANQSFHAEQRADVIERVNGLRVALDQRINSHLKALFALEAVVLARPDIDAPLFRRVGASLLRESTAIRQLQLAPNAVIRYGYPESGMEHLRGLDLRKLGGAQTDLIERIIAEGKPTMTGPRGLLQGYYALVARNPIYMQRNGAPQFWGLVSVLIDFEAFMAPMSRLLSDEEISVAIRGRDGLGAEGETFVGNDVVFRNQPFIASVTFPSGEWEIGGHPAAGWDANRPDAWLARLLMLAITLGVSIITWLAASGTVRNREMVRRLRVSNNRILTQAEQLERQNETLKESVRLREEVERIGRHDLKTPLNSIIAVPALLREQQALSPESAELVGIVERAGYRLLNMVNLSLDLYKMEQGSYRFRPQAVDIGALIDRVATDMRSHAAAKKVDIAITVNGRAPDQTPPVHVRAEELLCYSVLGNLLKNAVEAAPEGTAVTVTIDTRDTVAIQIHNHGAVPAEVRDRFFQKYASHGKTGGTGLGTYSAHLMARVQEGDLYMRTSETEGTTLTLTLQAAAAPAAAASESAPPEQAQAAAALPALQVLLVDDDEYNLLVMRRYLTAPLRVETAINGLAALDAAAANPPDVILMDLEMPFMNGLDAIAELRRREHDSGARRAMIIGLSSHDDQSAYRRSIAAGADFYLTKPVGRDELLRTIAALHAGQSIERPAGEERDAAPEQPGPADTVQIDADLRDSLEAFLQSRRNAVNGMVSACQSGNREELRQLAHRLSGSFALYGFRWASRHCKEIEREAPSAAPDRLAAQLALLQKHLSQPNIHFGDRDDIPATTSDNEIS